MRFGHRTSEDFDFFSNRPFLPDALREGISYLQGAEMRQFEQNTLTAIVAEKDFDAVLNDPYPGIFDRRSWVYWNVRYHHEPVPELRKRKIPQ